MVRAAFTPSPSEKEIMAMISNILSTKHRLDNPDPVTLMAIISDMRKARGPEIQEIDDGFNWKNVGRIDKLNLFFCLEIHIYLHWNLFLLFNVLRN